jgi:predicted nucleic acid-binding protein
MRPSPPELRSTRQQTWPSRSLASMNRCSALTRSLAEPGPLLLEILQGFRTAPVLPFDAAAAAVFDDLHAQRVRVATMDLRIAAIALSQGLVLLTRNIRDFSRVPALATEDWTV